MNGRTDGKVAFNEWTTNDLTNDLSNDQELKSVVGKQQQSTAKRRCIRASTPKRGPFNDIKNQHDFQLFQPDCNQRNQCNAHERLKSKICYICGLTSKFNRITDHLITQYKKKFGLDLVIDYFTPDTVCGTCRSNLSSNKRDRRFKFSRPIIWRPASDHQIYGNRDCYYCLVDQNASFFRKKDRTNLPQNSSCSLPVFGDILTMKEEIVNESDGEYNDYNSYVVDGNNQSVDQSIDPNVLQLFNQIINQTTNADQGLDQNRERQDSSFVPLSSTVSSTPNTADLLKNLRDDIYFLCEKLDDKMDRLQNDVDLIKAQQQSMDRLQNDLELIKAQQQSISTSLNLTSLMFLSRNLNDQLTGQNSNSPGNSQCALTMANSEQTSEQQTN